MGASQSQDYSEQNVENDSVKALQKQDSNNNVQPKPKVKTGSDHHHHTELVIGTAKSMEKTGEIVKLPHNYEAILKDADSPVDMSSMDKFIFQLYAGVFLNQKRKVTLNVNFPS